MNTKTTKTLSTTSMVAIGAGIAAVATASYYLFGPKGKSHRHATKEILKGWMIKMKGEIIEKIEEVKELTEPVYHDIVDSVVATYQETAKVSKEELQLFAERLKSDWKDIVATSLAKAPSVGTGKKRKNREKPIEIPSRKQAQG